MIAFEQILALPLIDFVAVALMISSFFALGWWIEHPGAQRPSVTMLMAERNHAWMREFVTREPRIFDSQMLASLRQGTSFFASTNLFAIGGLLALMGNTEPLRGVAEQIMAQPTPIIIWELKLGVVALFLVNAFLKFVWAHRVFGYTSVLMAAVPNDPSDPMAYPRAAQAAELNIRASLNFTRGLRAMYFALGALGWLLGGWGLLATSLTVIWLVWSREFASRPRSILLKLDP